MARPRALFIAPAAPARGGNGLAMRLGMFLEALCRVADTDLLVLPVTGSRSEESALARELDIRSTTVEIAGLADTHYKLLSQLSAPADRLAAFRLYGRGSRHASMSLPVMDAVRATAGPFEFDLVHVGRLYIAEAARNVRARHRTLDLDEDDAWAWRRMAELARKAGKPDESDWAETEADAEDRLLARVACSFDRLYVAGEADAHRLASRHRGLQVEVIPNGVAFPASSIRRDDGLTLLFVGTLTYSPNIMGLEWFVREVLPTVLQHREVRLRIIGRGSSPAVERLRHEPGVELVGSVNEVASAYETATLAIAPLKSGAGTRIKLIEAAAHKVPIVSTSIAAQGLDFDRDAIWLADTAPAFSEAIIDALSNTEERNRRAGLAHQRATTLYDRGHITASLADRFTHILEQSPVQLAKAPG